MYPTYVHVQRKNWKSTHSSAHENVNCHKITKLQYTMDKSSFCRLSGVCRASLWCDVVHHAGVRVTLHFWRCEWHLVHLIKVSNSCPSLTVTCFSLTEKTCAKYLLTKDGN